MVSVSESIHAPYVHLYLSERELIQVEQHNFKSLFELTQEF